MKIILLGPPGAGKGTQAELMAANLNLPHISPGMMLRSPELLQSELGQMAREVMNSGNLLPDDVINGLVRERLEQPDCQSGYILDGYPRSDGQARALHEFTSIDYVVEVTIPEAEIYKRLGGRRIHPASGRTYHVEFNPPKIADKDDVSGEDLVQREDDSDAAIQQRLRVYHEQTEPLIEFYRQLCTNGDATYVKVEEVAPSAAIQAKIMTALGASQR